MRNSLCRWMKDPISRWLRWNPTRPHSGEIRLGFLSRWGPHHVLQMVLIGNLWPFAHWPEQTRWRSQAGNSSPQRRCRHCARPQSHSSAPSRTCCCRYYCRQCRCCQSPRSAGAEGGLENHTDCIKTHYRKSPLGSSVLLDWVPRRVY